MQGGHLKQLKMFEIHLLRCMHYFITESSVCIPRLPGTPALAVECFTLVEQLHLPHFGEKAGRRVRQSVAEHLAVSLADRKAWAQRRGFRHNTHPRKRSEWKETKMSPSKLWWALPMGASGTKEVQ